MSGGKKPSGSPAKTPSAKRKESEGDGVDANIASSVSVAIELALARQQDNLEAAVTRAVQGAIDGMRNSIDNLERKVEAYMETVKELVTKVDRVQAETRAMKREVSSNTSDLEKMRVKVASLEDQDRRNNVRITGIATGREGGDAIAFLQDMLPKWIPSLGDAKIQIERAHRIRSNKNNGQATMIFKVLRYQDRNIILQGAREARKKAPIQDAGRTIRFYADYSAFTSERRNAYGEVMKEVYERGIPAFLIYPATLRMTINGEQRTFTSAHEAAQFLRKEAKEGPPPRRQLFTIGDVSRLEEDGMEQTDIPDRHE
ncbi:hypothetical protein L3Q82_002025 [Scortum barcoo]|uniref:Uncharacterized protein n=1 Tax=Scortum barcoo TaxID=214431 RepID=A0ACB8W4E5_9TELE|nr:hypothetical protein L3Q82_002025 [Scortum barcoo]